LTHTNHEIIRPYFAVLKEPIMSEATNTSLPQRMPQLRVMPMPADANIHGDVFGGWIMSQVDIAGAIPAARRANGRVATIAVNSFYSNNRYSLVTY